MRKITIVAFLIVGAGLLVLAPAITMGQGKKGGGFGGGGFPGGGPGGKGKKGGGGFPGGDPGFGADPTALYPYADAEFKKQDANGDGKLVPEEMSGTLKRNLDKWDKNGDGFIDMFE